MIGFLLEYGMYGMHAKPLKGALWRARFYDREDGRHYAGSADCPFEAIAWALYEREERIATGRHSMARSETIKPLQALAQLRGRS